MPLTCKSMLGSVALIAMLAACGDDPDDTRPIEILYFVQGPTGAPFTVVGPDDNGDCMAESRDQVAGLVSSGGYGFQTLDASHVLSGTFRAPHYFVFENEKQPTRGVFRNLGSAPLTVLQMRGLAPPATTLERQTIPPGACRSVSSFGDDDEIAGLAGADDPANDYRIEVCSFAAGTRLPPDFRCQDLAPRGSVEFDLDGARLIDAGAQFLSTIGDLTASFLSSCLAQEGSEGVACRTPATFYMFAPEDQISAAMTRFRNQPDSFLQLDLYRDMSLLDSDRGSGDVFVRDDI